jgi:hypothetical protein
MPTPLTPGELYVNAGESSDITATLYDMGGDPLSKAAITALTLTVKNQDGQVINVRDGSDILDVNGGTLDVDGTLKVKLQPADNAFVGSAGATEEHTVQIQWQWLDVDGDTRTGKQDFTIAVRRLPTESSSDVGWVG